MLLEREPQLVTRASYRNQARLHGGYHYPRSFATAYRSRLNVARFIADVGDAVVGGFRSLYAIARSGSRVTPAQFERFCDSIEAPYDLVDIATARLFEPRLIAAVYEVEEYAIDASILRSVVGERLSGLGVDVRTGLEALEVRSTREAVIVLLGDGTELHVNELYDCTYCELGHTTRHSGTRTALKHEIAEIALCSLPEEWPDVSLTVMDGPFFSVMPFPAKGLWSLSHVRYTPHLSWAGTDEDGRNPQDVLRRLRPRTRFGFMVRDAGRFVPALSAARYRESLYQVKTVLVRNEIDDGRPILLERSSDEPRIISVLGAKLDNVYDVLEAIRLMRS